MLVAYLEGGETMRGEKATTSLLKETLVVDRNLSLAAGLAERVSLPGSALSSASPPSEPNTPRSSKVRARSPKTRVIVTSGHVMLGAFDLASGVSFLPKPYARNAITGLLNTTTVRLDRGSGSNTSI